MKASEVKRQTVAHYADAIERKNTEIREHEEKEPAGFTPAWDRWKGQDLMLRSQRNVLTRDRAHEQRELDRIELEEIQASIQRRALVA